MWWKPPDELPLAQYVLHPDSKGYHARLEKLLGLARAGRACRSGYVWSVAHVSQDWMPCWQGERDALRRPKASDIHSMGMSERVSSVATATAPAGADQFIVFRIPGGSMNSRAVEGIIRHIRRTIRAAIKHQPPFEQAPQMLEIIPPERKFLLYYRATRFERDLERYRLYAHEGLGFRAIALLEYSMAAGRLLTPDQIPRRIRMPVPGENAVRMAVQRIYGAVYLKPMTKARRRRLDAPAEGMLPYRCEDHGRDCSGSCERFRTWWKRVSRTLPTPTTGKLRGEIAHPEGSLKRRA